jgi:molybdopterin synthase sulfur carrier subunit
LTFLVARVVVSKRGKEGAVARISFTQNLQRHLHAPPAAVSGSTVREALDAVFDRNPQLRSYVLDDQGRLRKHVAVFVDGQMIQDRSQLGDEIGESTELLVMQALSGG